PDTFVMSNADLVVNASWQYGVPLMGIHDWNADWGGLASLGTFPDRAGRRLAGYLDMIVNGPHPGDIPIEVQAPQFVVNTRAAACMGIDLDPTFVSQENRTIDPL